MQKEYEKRKIIFVVGNSRSGTTMMGRILGKHSKIFAFPHEIHFFENMWIENDKNKKYFLKESSWFFANLLSIARIGFLKRRYPEKFIEEATKVLKGENQNEFLLIELFGLFLFYEAEKNGKEIPCDQTPRNLFYINEILKYFPNAMIINMIRDPRDVLLSQKNRWRLRFLGHKKSITRYETLRSWIDYHPIITSYLWKQSILKSIELKSQRKLYNVKFENFVRTPYLGLQGLCKFIKVNFEENMLLITQITSSFNKFNPKKLGINKNTVERWKKGGLTTTDLFIVQKINSELMRKFGYVFSQVKLNLVDFMKFLFLILLLPFKMTLAFLFNIKRNRNIFYSLKKRIKLTFKVKE